MASGKWDYDCAVIGGGPGGLVSSIYLKRFRRSMILINSGKPRAAWIPKSHNILGFPKGISGVGILKRLNRHIDRLGTDRLNAEATVKRIKEGFEVRAGLDTLNVRKVILATGFDDIHPDIPNLTEIRKLGLLRYCSICDAYDHRDRKLAVLAVDDMGVAKGLFLAHFSRNIILILPEGYELGSRRIQQLRIARMKVVHGKVLAMDSPEGGTRRLEILLDSRKTIVCDAAYVELGCKVRDAAFSSMRGLRRSKEGFLIVTTEQRLSVPGLFAVGDCVNQIGQISVAAGQAAVAATTIHNDLLDF